MQNIKFEYPNELNIIFDKLNSFGILPFIVGGYVRDFFLGIVSKDIDIELYNVKNIDYVCEILNEFGDVNFVGKSFGVCKLQLHNSNLKLDFSLPRIDNKTGSGHAGFAITIDTSLDFSTAASRRDFTINAIGFNVIEKKIIDPFCGIEDLKNKLLKAVDIHKFSEDPLRVLRAIVFASRFNLKLDNKLFSACYSLVENDKLNELPIERVFDELKKVLLFSKNISYALKMFKQLNLLNFFHPFDTLDKKDFDFITTIFSHITAPITNNNTTNIYILLALLCYKFSTDNTILFIQRLTKEKKILENVVALHTHKFKMQFTESDILHLATTINIEMYLLYNKLIHFKIDSSIFESIKDKAQNLGVLHKKAAPLIQGRDLIEIGMDPSKEFSLVLQDAYKAQCNREFINKQEAIKWLRDYLA